MKKKYALYGGIGVAVLLFAFIIPFYNKVFSPSIHVKDGKSTCDFYIYPGDDYVTVGNKLLQEGLLSSPEGFQWMSNRMNYEHHVYPGRYILKDGMSNRQLVQLLRSGKQTPIRYTFIKFRTLDQLAADADEKFAFQKGELLDLLQDNTFLARYGFNRNTIMSVFIPNTYEFYWTVKPKEFIEKMLEEYRKFWSRNDRNQKCKKWGLDRIEVITLASIVEEETNRGEEKATIAGVYLNRIRIRMPLQADPTVKYAMGDFAATRVAGAMLDSESPYNTYRFAGIPPGPICTPSIPSIEAVLGAAKHEYLFFCAKPDGSGLHQFSKTLDEHSTAASQYHRMLNQNGIK